MQSHITITPKGERWYRKGHPWIYKDDLKKPTPNVSGQVVAVKASDGRLLGQAFYNGVSKIALRFLTEEPGVSVDRDFWAGRFEAALEYRRRVVQESNACRLIYSEADGFPGLIVDRYDTVLVFQVQSLGMEQILPLLTELAVEATGAKTVIAFNESPVRKLEGLPQERKVLLGADPGRLEITEGNRRYIVDFQRGQKTGIYLDQRENRLRARDFSRGRVLDAFAYQGAFSLQVADRAGEVLALEDSEGAVGLMKENLALNGVENVTVEKVNAFDRLKALDKEKQEFDLVILDPPAFAKSKQDVPNARRGYREINLRAMKILKPGGTLISCSCSHNVTDELFLEILSEASVGAGRAVRLVEIRTQAKDHPILLTHPESKYLKCLVLEVI